MPDDRIDVDALVEEVRAEAERLRERGRIARSIERDLNAHLREDIPPPRRRREVGRLRAALVDADRRTSIDERVPTASRIPAGGVVKRGVQRATGWYVGTITRQVAEFAGANLRVLRAVADALREIEADLTRLEERLTAVEDALHREPPDASPDDRGASP